MNKFHAEIYQLFKASEEMLLVMYRLSREDFVNAYLMLSNMANFPESTG